MGVEALTRVFEYAPHDGMELLVRIALANIADPAGVCWPGHEYLGLYARVKHERNLRQYLRALESTGNIYATRVAHRNLKTIYLVATAMSEEEIEQVLVHAFELHLDDARAIAADMIERQRRAEADFALPLSELRKNKRRGGGPQKRRIERSAKERRIARSARESGIERSANSTDKTRIARSPQESEIGRSSFAHKGGSPDPQRGIVGSTKADQRINSMSHFEASGRSESRSDPIMIQHDPNHDPPPSERRTTNRGGGGGPSETTLYLQDATNINTNVTEEFDDLPLARVKALVERKRRAGSQDGGIVIALRALRKRLQREALATVPAVVDKQADSMAHVEKLHAQARAIAPPGANEYDVQWLMVYLEEGASDDAALRLLAEQQARRGDQPDGA